MQFSMAKQIKNSLQVQAFILILTFISQDHKTTQATYLTQNVNTFSLLPEAQALTIAPFSFQQNVQENTRSSVLCTLSSGELPVTISWLKDGQLLTPAVAQARKITIKPDLDQSTLKFNSVRLDHAGNYTCEIKNRAGKQTHTAQLVVLGEPRWLKEPQHEPIVATRGQTIVIDCQTTGWPRPQQSWQIKTHTQAEFESLTPNGRITLAANGSLIIRNADKSDEANYLCKSSNGIGKGISWSTSLKVTVPAHFESTRQQTSFVRKQNQVQLRCDAFGDEPITIEWFKNKQKLTNELDSRYSIHNKPLPNGLISLLLIKQTQRQDNSIYECITRNPAGRDRLPIELFVQEEPDNIQELQATQINSRSVTLMWTEPYDGRSSITSYMFQYKKVQNDATPLLSELDYMSDPIDPSNVQGKTLGGGTTADDWQQASRIMLPMQANSSSGDVKSITIERLDPSTKYVLRALAINSIGQSKFSQPMEFVTVEEPPEIEPKNVKAVAINSTSIQVSWDEIAKSKQLSRIHGYYIGYRVAGSNSSTAGQNFVNKPHIINDFLLHRQHAIQDSATVQQQSQASSPSRLEFVINDLRRDTAYEITVSAFNARGSGPSSEIVLCKTIEMEVPKAVKLQIRRESNESIVIEWQRDPTDQNPVDDYVLYQEKNSASREWLQLRLPGNQTQFKAHGLKCGTRYQFYIIAHNKVGKSLPSEVVGASTSGALPVIPTKTSLIKMINSTCLQVNLNSFQDNTCRIRTFTIRYKIEKSNAPNGSMLISNSNGVAANHQALFMANNQLGVSGSTKAAATTQTIATTSSSEAQIGAASPFAWKTITPKSNVKHQGSNEEDRVEYLCDLSPVAEYTIHVSAANDVGRSEIEYTVLMSSDELRYSFIKEMLEVAYNLPNIPSVLVFLIAGLFIFLASLFMYTTVIKYAQKFVIFHNQIRATRRAKQDEKRRRKLNNSRHSQKLDLWADEYEDEEEEEEVDGDDEEEEDDSSASSSNRAMPHMQFANPAGHYMSNMANSAFDTSSIDSPCKNGNFVGRGSTCMSTASTDSIHSRFQCLNSKQYVKMNEYTMLPTISASLNAPHTDIYGTRASPQQQQPIVTANNAQNSLHYSTLRRSSMQTYLPPQRRQQQLHHQQQQQHNLQHRRSQNIADVYGYYMAPQVVNPNPSHQHAAEEAANSIFVPPQQIIYSAPNIRRQPPMFL